MYSILKHNIGDIKSEMRGFFKVIFQREIWPTSHVCTTLVTSSICYQIQYYMILYETITDDQKICLHGFILCTAEL